MKPNSYYLAGLVLIAMLGSAVCTADVPVKSRATVKSIVNVPTTPTKPLESKPVENSSHGTVISGGHPRFSIERCFSSHDSRFQVEYDQYDKLTAQLKDWPGDEFIYIIEGHVEVTDSAGTSKSYGPGDMFIIPKGFNGTWRQFGTLRKISVNYDWYDHQ